MIYRNASNDTARLPVGASGRLVTSDGTDVSWAAPALPKWFIEGLGLEYVSATTINILAGSCRDKANAANMTLAATVTPDITATASFAGAGTHGLDEPSLAATATTHGTATLEPSADIFAETALTSTVRSATGTISTVGTACTGVGTSFLTEISVNDVIRSATKGASRVTAIASNTACTLVAALPGGDCTTEAATIYENMVLWPDTAQSGDKKRVNTITHAGTSVVLASAVTSNGAGRPMKIGSEIASCWYAVWLCTDGTDTIGVLSTQRTTPYLSGVTAKRRVGWTRNHTSGDIAAGSMNGSGKSRTWMYNTVVQGSQVLTAGSATSATSVDCSTSVPPTSVRASVRLTVNTGQYWLFFLERNLPATTDSSSGLFGGGTSGGGANGITGVIAALDKAQCGLYYNSAASKSSMIDVVAFTDDLEK